uniref:Cytochrome P450 n=1 Tax=Clytia hemisphaerica TaxID=252671 RepID=A0A7M5V396_9CNID
MLLDLTCLATLFIGGVLLLLIWWKVYTRNSFHGDITFIPGDWPLIGHIPIILDQEKFRALSDKWYKDFDGTFGYYLTTKKLVITSNVKVINDLLSNSRYLKKSWGYVFLEALIGKGLVTSDGELWKERRRLITPAFHFGILNGFIPCMERCVKELIQLFDEHAENGTTFNVLNMGTKLTMAVICETSMGQRLSLRGENGSDFKALYENATNLMVKRFFRPWLFNDFIYSLSKDGKLFLKQRNALRSWVKNIIEDRIEFHKNKGVTNDLKATRKIFIDVLLDSFERRDRYRRDS